MGELLPNGTHVLVPEDMMRKEVEEAQK